jgi:hypothetical protein
MYSIILFNAVAISQVNLARPNLVTMFAHCHLMSFQPQVWHQSHQLSNAIAKVLRPKATC